MHTRVTSYFCGTVANKSGYCIGVSLIHLTETLGLATPKKCYNMVYLNTSTCTLNRHAWNAEVHISCSNKYAQYKETRAPSHSYTIHSHQLWVPCWKKEYLKFDCRFPDSRSFNICWLLCMLSAFISLLFGFCVTLKLFVKNIFICTSSELNWVESSQQ